jgi:cell filamentation protein
MSRKQGYDALKFELITEKKFANYVLAVQSSADKNYEKMEKIIGFIFPD